MKKNIYNISLPNIKKGVRFALVSDLHGGDPKAVIEVLKEETPDYILMPGDIFEVLDGTENSVFENGMKLLTEAVKIAPTFFSMGNHEDGATRSWSTKWKKTVKSREYNASSIEKIRNCGVHILSDDFIVFDGIAFGGLLTGLIFEERMPDILWLEEYCKQPEPKVLLCHHPEYYEKYLKDLPIDLVVSGHAHGGQWRFFGRGVFAPGQGIFPEYTKGVYDNKLVVSTGLKKGIIPRFFNPTEVVIINIV